MITKFSNVKVWQCKVKLDIVNFLLYKVFEPQQFTSQVVAGQNVIVKVLVSAPDAPTKYVMVKYFEQPWTNTLELKKAWSFDSDEDWKQEAAVPKSLFSYELRAWDLHYSASFESCLNFKFLKQKTFPAKFLQYLQFHDRRHICIAFVDLDASVVLLWVVF